MVYRLVAAAAFVMHVAFVAFTVVGGFIALLAPWLLFSHLAAAAWGGRMAATRAVCPLSALENWGRQRGGQPRLDERGFIAHYFEGRVYPRGWGRRVQFVAGGLIVSSWALMAAR